MQAKLFLQTTKVLNLTFIIFAALLLNKIKNSIVEFTTRENFEVDTKRGILENWASQL